MKRFVAVALVVAVALGGIAWLGGSKVSAQERRAQLKKVERQAQKPEPGQRRRPNEGARQRWQRFMQARMLMARRMVPQPVAICAHGDYIYVVRGNMLYQFTAEDLQLVNKVKLEEELPAPPVPKRGQ